MVKMTTIKVIVKPGSKQNSIQFDPEKNVYKVCVKAPADKNKANKELIKILTKHFNKQVRIKKGIKNKEKMMEF